MTYYTTPRGAKVFSAGVMNFGGSALWPVVSAMMHEPLGGAEPAVSAASCSRSCARRGRRCVASPRTSSCGRSTRRRSVGSTTTEYTPAPPRAPPHAAEPSVAWRTYGYDQERTRRAALPGLRPPFRRAVDVPRPLAARVPAGRRLRPRLSSRTSTAGSSRSTCDRRDGLAVPVGPLRLGLAGARRPPRVRDVHRQRRVPLGASRRSRRRLRRALRHGCGGCARSGRRSRRRSSSAGRLRRGLERPRVGARRADGTNAVDAASTARSRARWRSAAGGSSSAPTAARSASLGAETGSVLWRSGGHGSFYSSPAVAYGRVYIGSLDGGVYAFGAAPGSALVAADRWVRLRLAGDLAPERARRLVRPRLLRARRGHGRGALAGSTAKAPISGAATRRRRARLLLEFDERTYALAAGTGRRSSPGPTGSTRRPSPPPAASTSSASAGCTRSPD